MSARKLSLLLLVSLPVAFLVACGGNKQTKDEKPEKNKFADAPKWSSSPPDGCSVGIVKYRGNRGLARSTAASRGRDSLARQLRTKVEGMIKDYQSQGETKGESFTEEQTTQVSRQIVSNTLVGTKVQATYITDSEDPHYYSLICLKPGTLTSALDKMKELSGKQKKALKKRADKEFQDLDKQLEKHGLN